MKQAKLIQFNKDYTALKSYLLGRNYTTSLRVLAYAKNLHNGFRKDQITPEFHHQIRIAFSILNLRDVANEEMCLSLSALHDTPEDKAVSYSTLADLFGHDIAYKSCLLNKHQYASESECFAAVANDIDCSLVKGADNSDNIQSMIGVFTNEKMKKYMERTKVSVLPMLKTASTNFPEQSFAYSSLRVRLKDQLALYKIITEPQTTITPTLH